MFFFFFQMECSVALLTVLGLMPTASLTASFATRRVVIVLWLCKVDINLFIRHQII